jgi:hypothetical protein
LTGFSGISPVFPEFSRILPKKFSPVSKEAGSVSRQITRFFLFFPDIIVYHSLPSEYPSASGPDPTRLENHPKFTFSRETRFRPDRPKKKRGQGNLWG